jgi:hypothetical protein
MIVNAQTRCLPSSCRLSFPSNHPVPPRSIIPPPLWAFPSHKVASASGAPKFERRILSRLNHTQPPQTHSRTLTKDRISQQIAGSTAIHKQDSLSKVPNISTGFNNSQIRTLIRSHVNEYLNNHRNASFNFDVSHR